MAEFIVGAYIEIHANKYEVDEINTTCCGTNQWGKFCPNCGKELNTKTKSERQHDLYTLIDDEFENRLVECEYVKENCIIAISNIDDLVTHYHYDSSSEYCLKELTGDSFKHMKSNMIENFKDVIDHIKNHDDVISVDVKCGSFVYHY